MKSILVVWDETKISEKEISKILEETNFDNNIKTIHLSEFLESEFVNIKLVIDLKNGFGITIWEILE